MEFLTGLDNSYSSNRASMLSLFEEIAEHPENPIQWIPSKKCHTITTDNKIWQFTVGRLRVAWFFDQGNIIICTHGFFKDSQTTKKADQNKAQKTRAAYFAAKEHNNIEFEKEDSE